MNRTTLKDVALAAGVSTASVSRALSASGSVTSELRMRIMAAATRLGYRPNLAARALATQRSGLVAIVASGMMDGLVGTVIDGAQGCLAERGYAALLAKGRTRAEALSAAHGCMAHGVEGILWLDLTGPSNETDLLGAKGLPRVAISDVDSDASLHIDLGRASGAELACRYLVDLGHQRIDVLVRPGMGLPRGLGRIGTKATFTARVLDDEELRKSVAAAIEGMLEANRPSTALVCSSDFAALSAIRECAVRSISVPEQLSIVGFGDEAFARCAWPALTTLRVPGRELGATAASMLVDTLLGRQVSSYRPPLKLVVRETTGPVPGQLMFHVEQASV